MITIIRDKILNHLVCFQSNIFHPPSTFVQASQLTPLSQGAESVPIVIVGNKSDVGEGKRKISVEQGQKLAQDLKCGWIETSAAKNTNVARAFEMMIAEIEKSQEPDKPAGGGKCAVQ
jgi:GTPase SAR1 family protein